MTKEQPLKIIAGSPDHPLRIGGIEIPCYVLEDETRVLTQTGVFNSVGAVRRGGGDKVPQFMSSKAIRPFISSKLTAGINSPIEFQPVTGGRTAYGYPATLLSDICAAVIEAKHKGKLDARLNRVAERCWILMRGFSTVGIIALVDEATGYDRIRSKKALVKILEEFIAKELHPWTKTFPYEFYEQICRLRGWPGYYAVKRPHVVADYTNEFIYMRIAPGVLKELRKLNPIDHNTGERKVKHHQWFTEDFGHPKLKEHIAAVTALMRASANMSKFKTLLVRAYPQKYDNFLMAFMEDD